MGTSFTVAPESITFAKMQNVSASKLLGRGDSGAGDPEEITLGAGLTISGTTLSASGGGGGAWSLVATSTPTGVPNVDFTGLSGYTDLLLIGIGVSGSASSFRAINCSTDNGASFFGTSGDYVRPSAAGSPSNQVQFDLVNAQSASALTFSGMIFGINVNGAPKKFQSTGQFADLFFKGSLSPVNAIRYWHSTAGNITGGTLYLLGR
jgi:hypothetical protein